MKRRQLYPLYALFIVLLTRVSFGVDFASGANLLNVKLLHAVVVLPPFTSTAWSGCQKMDGIGVDYSALSEEDRARVVFGGIAQLDCPSALQATVDSRPTTDLDAFWQGYLLERDGKHLEALERWREYPATIGRFFFRLNQQETTFRFSAAMDLCGAATQSNPDNINVWQCMGEAAMRLEDWGKAEEAFAGQLARYPNRPQSLFWYGRIQRMSENNEQAIQWLKRAITATQDKGSTAAFAWYELGRAYLQLGNPEEALKSFRRTRELAPGFLYIDYVNAKIESLEDEFLPWVEQDSSLSAINLLWRRTIHEMLKDELWGQRDAYDAGHFLMIPLHSAFSSQNDFYKNDFSTFFAHFQKTFADSKFDELDTLTRLHFLYLTSQYLVLNKTFDGIELEELTRIVKDELERIWGQPAGHWAECSAPSFQSMAERLEWKLHNEITRYNYCRAIVDNELFSFAIAADLKLVLLDQAPVFIDEILEEAYAVFKQEVIFLGDSDRWFLQPGVWSDHRDYAYSGHSEIRPDLEKNPVSGISSDSSHFHRFPLWLLSLEKAYPEKESEEAELYEKLRNGLASQFLEKVLVLPSDEFPNYRTKNFMDGYNGIYRYGYVTQGQGSGYGPYELSGSLYLGWWSFLPDESISDVYCYISSRFPLSEEEIDVYLGPDTTRDRHPLIKGISKYENGLSELISRLICESKDIEQ